MTLQRFGGLAGLTCAATYLFGFVFLVTRLAPLGYGTNEIDGNTVVDFIQTEAGFLILWNTVIYIVNALALTLLVVALHKRLRTATPDLSAVAAAEASSSDALSPSPKSQDNNAYWAMKVLGV